MQRKKKVLPSLLNEDWDANFSDYAIDPFVAGVFAGKPEQLVSVRSAFPKLYALEEKYGGLVKGMTV